MQRRKKKQKLFIVFFFILFLLKKKCEITRFNFDKSAVCVCGSSIQASTNFSSFFFFFVLLRALFTLLAAPKLSAVSLPRVDIKLN